MKHLESRIGRWLKGFGWTSQDPAEVWQNVKNKQVSYEGEEFMDPVPLTVEQIETSLPPLGHGGSVNVIDFLVGKCRHLIQHPQEILVDEAEKVPGPNTAKVHISGGDSVRVWTNMALFSQGCLGFQSQTNLHPRASHY